VGTGAGVLVDRHADPHVHAIGLELAAALAHG